MKLKKESKIRVLENFYSLDYVLFGKPASKIDVCCPVFVEEYLSVKGALMSVVIEMYKLVKHSPAPLMEKVNTKDLIKSAKNSAIIARENCKKLVTSQKGRETVKQDLRESLSKTKKKVDIERLVQEKIRTKAYSLAVDNLLVGRAITESKKYSKLNTWNGRIIEDAYKILRDNLVEAAMNIIENSADEDTENIQEISASTSAKFLKLVKNRGIKLHNKYKSLDSMRMKEKIPSKKKELEILLKDTKDKLDKNHELFMKIFNKHITKK